MSNKLSLLSLLTASLATGCVIINDDGGSSDGGSATETTSTSNGSTTTDSGGSGSGSSAGSASGSSGSGSSASGSSGGSSSAGSSSAGTGPSATCGWGQTGVDDPPEGYICGGNGADPSNANPLACPDGLRAGAACGDVTGVGCCDADGNLWYCTADDTLYKETCG